MIQQRTIQQSYYCPRTKQRRQRPVRVATRIHFDDKAKVFKSPKTGWRAVLNRLFRMAA
jgi:hypothetical protein